MIDISYNIDEVKSFYPGTQKYICHKNDNSSILIIDSHHGTHIDAPSHFIKDGKNVSEIDRDLFFGDVQIISIYNNVIDNDILSNINIKCDRIFFNCILNDMREPFIENYCGLDFLAAKYLVSKNIKVVGINYVSIEKYNNNNSVHIKLLLNDIMIIEGLNLENIEDGIYEYVCLPINTNNEASPTRVVLKKLK